MKTRKLAFLILLSASCLLHVHCSSAQTLFWDPDNAGNGSGTGTWTAAGRWDSPTLTTPGSTTWTNNSNANFQRTDGGTTMSTEIGGTSVVANSLNVVTTGQTATVTTVGAGTLTVGTVNLTGNLNLAQQSGSTSSVTYFVGAGGITAGGAGTLTLTKSGNALTNLFVSLGSGGSVGSGGAVTLSSTDSGYVGFYSTQSSSIQRSITNNSSLSTTYLGTAASTTLSITNAAVSGSAAIQIGSTGLGHSGNGTVALNAGSSMSSSASTGITVSAGTLALNASNVVGNTTALTLSGGTLLLASGVSETMGALTLTQNSVIDFGSGGAGSTLRFDTVDLNNLTVSIWNYQAGIDHLFFGDVASGADLTDATKTSTNTFLGANTIVTPNVRFYTNNGVTPIYSSGGFIPTGLGEIVPVPEPTAMLSLALLLLVIGWKERHHFARVRMTSVNDIPLTA